MAGTSSSAFITSKLEFPVPYFHGLTKRLPPLTPFNNRSHDCFCNHNKFLISPITSEFRISKSSGLVLCSLVDVDSSIDDAAKAITPQVEVKTSIWNWRGYSIRYQYAGSSGPALVLVHGFGANRSTSIKFLLLVNYLI